MKSNSLTLLVAIVTLGVVSSPNTAQEVVVASESTSKIADPSGTWRWESEEDGETITNQLKVDSDGAGKLTAIYNGLFDNLKSVAGNVKGDRLKLDFKFVSPEQNLDVQFVGTIKGDDGSGTITFSDDGTPLGNVPWDAKRSVELSDVDGKWSLLVEADEQHEATLTVVDKNGKYSASYVGREVGECPVKDLKAKDNMFFFTVTGKLEGRDFTAMCTTKPLGRKLTGEMALDISGDNFEFPISAKLAKQTQSAVKLSDLVGTWNLRLRTDEEDLEPKLIVSEKDGKYSGVLDGGDVGEFLAKGLRVKGDILQFSMAGEIDGQDFEAQCFMKVGGGNLTGEMMLELGGEEMQFPLSGKLAK